MRTPPLSDPERGEVIAGRIMLCLPVLAVLAYVATLFVSPGQTHKSSGNEISVALRRGNFTVFCFPSKKSQTLAIIVFGSGDLGWGSSEEVICHGLQAAGYEVVGIDSQDYAHSDYDLDTLQQDFGAIAQSAEAPFGNRPPPLILGGYSMGAEQAIPAAGGPHPPAGMVGLLLASPGNRGRYGLRHSDQLNIEPTGPGTFAMKDFANTLGDLRVVQWHSGLDPFDSREWLNSLTAPHQEFDFPHGFHNYNFTCADFVRQFVASVDWILSPVATNTTSIKSDK